MLSLDTGSEVQFYHHDALGSTVNLTTDAGEVKVSYWIDPYGQIRKQEGTSVNRQVFTGQEIDENTGLVYFGARYYDPDTARFITQDSYLGESGTPPSLHRYLYCYSNSTVNIDTDGHIVFTAAAIAVGTYLVWKGAESAVETGIEAGISRVTKDKDFSVGKTFLKNMAVNSTIGLIPGATEAKIGTKAAIYAGKLALRTTGD